MTFKKVIDWIGLVAVIAAAIGLAPAHASTYAAPLAQSGNLLQNPGLEQSYQGCGSGQTASGWGCWYQEIDKPDEASGLQYSAKAYFSAETNASGQYPGLIHGGEVSQHFGYQLDPWIAGIYQTVTVPPNALLRFCAWSRIHASNTENPTVDSVTSYLGRSQVGISPNASTAVNSANIVWSGKSNPHDNWQQMCVEATSGPEGKVTVFTSNDWRGAAAKHLDAWWDDAELVTLGVVPTVQPTATAGAVQPTTAAQPQPTALPPVTNADGSIVHTIAAGDTLFGLSFQYNVALDTILALNGLTKDSLLSIGQKIIIKGGTGAAPVQPTAIPQPTAAPAQPTAAAGQPVQPTPQPTVASAQPAANAAKLCVRAYSDANGDGLLTKGEAAVAGVQFAVANSQGVQAASYTSDASGEEHCFTDLPPGSYTVAVQPAPGTVATSDKRWGVALTGGSVVNINFGSRGDVNAPAAGAPPTTATTSGGAGLSGLLGGAIGLILLLVAGVLGAFIIARRRA